MLASRRSRSASASTALRVASSTSWRRSPRCGAITYHRELRRKASFKSILDELPGIGPVKRRALLRTLGSLEKVRGATLEELAAVPKITQADAGLLHRFFHPPAVDTQVKDASAAADEAGDPEAP